MTPKSHYFGSTIVGTLGNFKEFVFKAGTGPGNPSVQEIALFPNSAHYNIISDTCTGKTLGKTCKLAVRFKARVAGPQAVVAARGQRSGPGLVVAGGPRCRATDRHANPGLITACPRLGPRDAAKRRPGAVRSSIGVQAVELPDVTRQAGRG